MSIKTKKRANKPILATTTGVDDDPLLKLVGEMGKVETTGKESDSNQSSNDDNNGGRYWYNFFLHVTKGKKKP